VSNHNDGRQKTGIHALEILFLAFVGALVLAAFVEAFSYKLVSSRTPFVIMVPLIALIGVQAFQLRKAGALAEVRYHIGEAMRGRNAVFGKLGWLLATFVVVGLLIWTLGHYIGVAIFMLALMRWFARERWVLALLVTAGTVAALFLLFEQGFNVELYRGLLFRYLAGYRVF